MKNFFLFLKTTKKPKTIFFFSKPFTTQDPVNRKSKKNHGFVVIVVWWRPSESAALAIRDRIRAAETTGCGAMANASISMGLWTGSLVCGTFGTAEHKSSGVWGKGVAEVMGLQRYAVLRDHLHLNYLSHTYHCHFPFFFLVAATYNHFSSPANSFFLFFFAQWLTFS